MRVEWCDSRRWSPPTSRHLDLWRVFLSARDGDWELLDASEQARFGRVSIEAKRVQRVAARAALRRILSRYLELDPPEVALLYEAKGKPALAGESGPIFNLSHSGRLAMVAVAARGCVGVDVEECLTRRPFERLARRAFAPGERSELATLGPEAREDGFYRFWTCKEAYLKAWGTGLSFPSRRFTVSLAGGPRLVSTEMPDDEPEGWRWTEVIPSPGYRAAVCWRGESETVRYWQEV